MPLLEVKNRYNNKKLFNKKVFRDDGKSFVLAMDHAMMMPSANIDYPKTIIESAVDGGVDAFLTSYGIIKNFRNEFRDAGVILRADGGISALKKPMDKMDLLYTPEDAINLGVDAMLCMGYPGSTTNEHTLKYLAKLCAMGDKYNVAIGAEMLPFGFEKHEGVDTRSVENVSFACRQGCELGADFIKTEFVGEKRFVEVVENSYSPIMVLGGANAKSPTEMFKDISSAIEYGASGIIMGRNILRHKNINAICRAISKIIHENISVDEALKISES